MKRQRQASIVSELESILSTQATNIAAKTGAITPADISAVMPEAREMTDRLLGGEPLHPDLREWATLGVALNALARSRGYDPATDTRQRAPVRTVSVLEPLRKE